MEGSTTNFSGIKLSAVYSGNIDLVDLPYGYVLLADLANSSSTFPTVVNSNTAFIMGFSRLTSNKQKIRYGGQIAIGFGSRRIAIRYAGYNDNGSTWSDWGFVTPAS